MTISPVNIPQDILCLKNVTIKEMLGDANNSGLIAICAVT